MAANDGQPDYDALAAQHGGQPDYDSLAAQHGGWTAGTVKMIGPQGQTRTFNRGDVGPNYLNQARAKGWAVTPDTPDAQKMVTPGGQVTYAMPDEIGTFEQSGHRRIDAQGRKLPTMEESAAANDRMNALSGMTGMPTPNMTPEQRQDFASGKAAGHASGMVTIPIVAGGASAPAVGTAIRAAAATPLGQQIMRDSLHYAVKGAAAGLGWKLGGKWLGKIASGFLE